MRHLGRTEHSRLRASVEVDAEFRAAVHAGLSAPAKTLPCRFFYDAEGSRLFDRICALPEYYPTRTELALLRSLAPALAAVIGPRAEVVEFGAGAGVKIRLLLDALEQAHAYRPIDICGEHLLAAARGLARDYPTLEIRPVIADFTQPLPLPASPKGVRRVGFFPGSTIGNLTPPEARRFLASARRLLNGGGLLIGVDLVKNREVLRRAYDDAQGVTAAFNRNILARANRELGADFRLEDFAHAAMFNENHSRMEMHLRSTRPQTVRVDGRAYVFAEGETIHTENSYKYTVEGFCALARVAGFEPQRTWTDADRLFSLHWLAA